MTDTTNEEIETLRSENRRLTAALIEAQTRDSLVLEATNDGVWDWDLTTDQAFFSDRWSGILGYEREEIADNGGAFFQLVHPDDRPKVQAAIEAHFERRVPYVIEFRMQAKGGGLREIQARGQAVWDDEGKPVRMAGIHTDITERRAQERERLRNEELLAIQEDTIRALGVPILQVWKDILCVPIIGVVDDVRATDMTSALLERVGSSATRFAIIDLTAAKFRGETAQYLGRMTGSLGLLGTQSVFCGVSPETAMALIDMDLDLGGVPTYRHLGDALRTCLQKLRESV